MTVAIETHTPDLNLQLTDTVPLFSLLAKGSVTPSSSWGLENTPYVYATRATEITIPQGNQNTDAMLAVRSPNGAWAHLVEEGSNYVKYLICSVPGGAPVEWYYFSIGEPPTNPSRSGIEIYGPGGSPRIFASDFPIARPLGMITQNGYQGISNSTAKVAIVPIKRAFSWYSETEATMYGCIPPGGGSATGYTQTREDFGESSLMMADIGTSSVDIRFFYGDTGKMNMGCSWNFEGPRRDSQASQGWAALVLDVSNY